MCNKILKVRKITILTFYIKYYTLKIQTQSESDTKIVFIIYFQGEYRDVFIPVPLKSINISCQLINYVAEVTVLQEYLNVEEGPIECEYMFPIEEESAVIEFTATLEGKTLVSKVGKLNILLFMTLCLFCPYPFYAY